MKIEQITLGNKYPINGKLTLPTTGSAPYPAVVLVQGSGSHDMDETIYAIKPFRDLAEGLADLGIASIRYDMSTYTHGKQMVKDLGKHFSVQEEKIDDAIAATDLLRKDERIDSDNIFLVGHSLGACIAPRVDLAGGDYAGLVLMAGSPRRLEEVMIDQQNDFIQNAKGPVKWLVQHLVKGYRKKFAKLYTISDEEAKEISLAGMKLYYLQDLGATTVAEYLHDYQKPLLVMHPKGDLQVSYEKDFKLYQEILKDHPDSTFVSYDGLNHAFMKAHYTDIRKVAKEFKIPQHIEKEVIADIAAWIKEKGNPA